MKSLPKTEENTRNKGSVSLKRTKQSLIAPTPSLEATPEFGETLQQGRLLLQALRQGAHFAREENQRLPLAPPEN